MRRSIIVPALACAAPALAAPTGYHTAVSAMGPALWYQFNETTGNAHNFGSLGSAFDAMYEGTIGRETPSYAGDTAARFDSADDVMESLGSSTLTGNPTFTIEAIVRLDAGGAASFWGPFLHWGDGGGGQGGSQRTGKEVYFSISNNLNDRIYAGFFNAGVRTTGPVPTNNWIHVVWVRQGGNDSTAGTTVYINGTPYPMEQDPALSPGLIPASSIDVTSTPFHIHRAADFVGQRFFTGNIDELALYTRALSAAEVQTLWNAAGLGCYANCDNSNSGPILNVNDFICFQSRFAAGDSYANCDGSINPPVLNVNDFICFQTRFVQGCP